MKSEEAMVLNDIRKELSHINANLQAIASILKSMSEDSKDEDNSQK